ncbi:deoxyribonuclease-1-like 1 [Hyperolius riggenbachi]|uniref:deoxyribonuclease-1-like 1 n=1 Tax=Hyperolius riggenbachi TaxID=752182 RepID=UPI0035A32124
MTSWLHLLLLQLLWPCVSPFKVCAFNAQHFGEKKAANDEVMDALVKIVQRCDICLVQEVQDPKGLAVSKLLQALNRPADLFLAVVSPSIGRKSYTEQYVFIYKKEKILVSDQYQYEDNHPSQPDVFAREPYIVRFTVRSPALRDLVIIPQHTEPDKAAVELEALYDVFTDVSSRWRCQNVVMMGDFNAGCSYLSKKKRRSLRLYTDTDFHWLISDNTDTTVRESTDCPYDRIVVYGQTLVDMVTSAGIYNFTKELRLTEAQALKVSDHYPVEMNLDLTFDSCLSLLPSISLILLGLLTAVGTKTVF